MSTPKGGVALVTGSDRGIGTGLRMNALRAAVLLPDAGEMRLARADGSGQDDHRRRPLRPGIDDGDGSTQTVGDQEIVTTARGIMGKDQRKLLSGLALCIVHLDSALLLRATDFD